jgi:cell filamentation protein
MRKLFGRLQRDNNLQALSALELARGAATFLATLNAIHAFRDGNGRSQLAFVAENERSILRNLRGDHACVCGE